MNEDSTTPMASADVRLCEITRKSLRAVLALKVTPEQEAFVATNAQSIAEAHFARDAWFRAIYAGDTPVGFLMLSDVPEKAEYFLWRLMIAAPHQGKGYGRRAIELLIEHVKTRPNATALYTSHREGPGGPGGFYRALGFVPTGEMEEGEHLLRLELGSSSVC